MCNMLINDGVVFLHFILVVCVTKKRKILPSVHRFHSALKNLVLPGLNIDTNAHNHSSFSPLLRPCKPVRTQHTVFPVARRDQDVAFFR